MTAGDIYTIAGTGSQGVAADGTPALSAALTPWDQAVDAAGNLIFYDSGVNKIRVIPATTGIYYGIHTTADHVYSIVGGGTGSLGDGGPGRQATINFVFGLAANGRGLAFTDQVSDRVRMILR